MSGCATPAPIGCTNNSQCAPRVCISGQCVNCTTNAQCDAPNVCNITTGQCVAPQPPPPGFNCNNAGCVGDNAGLVCNTATGQCVNCTSFEQCGGGICNLNGRCLGFVACDENVDCAQLLSTNNPDLEPLVCNEDGTDNPQAPDDVCIFDDEQYNGQCNNDNDCPDFGGNFPTVCVLGSCLADCRAEGQKDCDEFYNPNVAVCVNGVCILRD